MQHISPGASGVGRRASGVRTPFPHNFHYNYHFSHPCHEFTGHNAIISNNYNIKRVFRRLLVFFDFVSKFRCHLHLATTTFSTNTSIRYPAWIHKKENINVKEAHAFPSWKYPDDIWIHPTTIIVCEKCCLCSDGGLEADLSWLYNPRRLHMIIDRYNTTVSLCQGLIFCIFNLFSTVFLWITYWPTWRGLPGSKRNMLYILFVLNETPLTTKHGIVS